MDGKDSPAKVATKKGLIEQQLVMFNDVTEDLAKQTAVLYERLSPILGPELPPNSPTGDPEKEPLPELADSLRNVRYCLMESIEKLHSLRKRIEL